MSNQDSAICVIGLESVGKSALLQSLTGKAGRSEAMRGATLYCESYEDSASGIELLDTPGLIRASDSETTREALRALTSHTDCLLVLKAFSAIRELEILWQLVRKKKLVVALTNQDMLSESSEEQQEKLEKWQQSLGVPVVLVNATDLSEDNREQLRVSIKRAELPGDLKIEELPTWTRAKEVPPNFLLDNPVTAGVLLVGPTFAATYGANALADAIQPSVSGALDQISLPDFLMGPYGLVSMMPFLFLYALPTIVFFSFLLALYKSSGLLDRLSQAIHPWISLIGLGGRDAVRVIMGFGCNVPAVVATRACHSCSRGACVSAIAFGAACSYQMPATLAVFAAAGKPELVFWYVFLLLSTTAIYLRFTVPKRLRIEGRRLLLEERAALHPINWKQAFRDTKGALKEFFGMAFPVFIAICIGASILQGLGVLDLLTGILKPAMAVFNLPPETVTAVILGSIRKDGLAVGLLDPSWNGLKVPAMTSGQLLTSVYLAGLLLPCLVTLITIGREMGTKHALQLALRQAGWVVLFAACIGWSFWAL